MVNKTVDPKPCVQTSDWPEEGLESVRQCPVCGSEVRSRLHEGLTDRVFFCAPGRWTLYQCEKCHSAYLDPRPTPETYHIAYQRYYTHTAPKRLATAELKPVRRFIRALVNDYRNYRYGGHLLPVSPFGRFAILALPNLRREIDRGLRHLPFVWPGARLLDVGFGSGLFLEMVRDLGWTVVGVDPDPIAVETAQLRGLDVQQGGIEALADQVASFDVITLNHVIEHLHEPRKTIELAFTLLKPGGMLFLETPNIESAGHLEFGKDCLSLDPPRHLMLFTWASLESLLREAGFDRIKPRPCFNAYKGIAGSSRAVHQEKDYQSSKIITMNDRVKSFFLGANIYFNHRLSEFITLVAYKPN